jgi:hypothetical protein
MGARIRLGHAAIAVTAILLATVNARSAQITVTIDSVGGLPNEMHLVPKGVGPQPISHHAPSNSYIGTVAAPGANEPIKYFTVVGRWDNTLEQFYVRVSQKTPFDMPLRMYFRKPIPNKATLERIDNLGKDFFSLSERFFVARDVFRGLSDGSTAMKAKALRIWFDAAYQLARDYSYVAPDDEVIEFAESAGGPYYTAMIKQYRSIEWKDVELIAQYKATGNVTAAAALNDYFSDKLNAASDAEIKAALSQGVNRSLLDRNAAYFRTLQN